MWKKKLFNVNIFFIECFVSPRATISAQVLLSPDSRFKSICYRSGARVTT